MQPKIIRQKILQAQTNLNYVDLMIQSDVTISQRHANKCNKLLVELLGQISDKKYRFTETELLPIYNCLRIKASTQPYIPIIALLESESTNALNHEGMKVFLAVSNDEKLRVFRAGVYKPRIDDFIHDWNNERPSDQCHLETYRCDQGDD